MKVTSKWSQHFTVAYQNIQAVLNSKNQSCFWNLVLVEWRNIFLCLKSHLASARNTMHEFKSVISFYLNFQKKKKTFHAFLLSIPGPGQGTRASYVMSRIDNRGKASYCSVTNRDEYRRTITWLGLVRPLCLTTQTARYAHKPKLQCKNPNFITIWPYRFNTNLQSAAETMI